jgi:hypothetical protein
MTAIQRIAMAIVALPKEQRAAHYTLVRRNFEAAIKELALKVIWPMHGWT